MLLYRFRKALANIAFLGHKLLTDSDALPYSLTDPKVRIAAIGDIHGRADLLRALFARLDEERDADSTELVEVYLGDYVDRGPCSPEVIELLIDRQRQQSSIICLKGKCTFFGSLRGWFGKAFGSFGCFILPHSNSYYFPNCSGCRE